MEGRYRGSMLGLVWSFVSPLVLLAIYTFVFGVVFRVRWPGQKSSSLAEFALMLFAGLLVLNVFGECATRSTGLIVSVPNYVKKVVFPLEVLPVCVVGAAFFHGAVALLVLLLAHVALSGTLHLTLLWLPLVVLPLLFWALAASWFLASFGVFLRDIQYLLPLLIQMLPFVTPTFYPESAVPEPYRHLIALNPLSPVVEDVRRVLLLGLAPRWLALALSMPVAAAAMYASYYWFMRTKKAFADVI